MMATLSYNRIAICVASVVVLWVLAAAFRSHSSLSLQDIKDIASGISVSTPFGGSGAKSKPPGSDDLLTDHFDFDDSYPPPSAAQPGGGGSTWGEEEAYDGYDEYDIAPPGLHDAETYPGAEEAEHYQHAAPSAGGSSTYKWGTDDVDDYDYEDPSSPSHDASGTSQQHDSDTSSSDKTSSSSSGGKGSSSSSWFSSGKTKTWDLPDFRREWLRTELGGNLEDGKELRRACAKADFSGRVVLHMMHSRGGVTNVRGGVLDLVWFAVLTGSDIVLPGYIIRPDATAAFNWDDESLGYYGLENMFDRDWFLHVMAAHCPQMTIYPEADAVPSAANLTHNDLFHDARADLTLVNTEASLVGYFTTWLQAQPQYQPAAVNLVFINKMMWYFNWLPRPRLRKEMGHLVKIAPQIRELAATAVYHLRETYHLDSIDPAEQLYRDAYYGVHLRTEADAQQMGWTTDFGGFDRQSDIYIEKCKELGLQVIYAASGSREDILKLAAKAKPHHIQVVSKDDLLSFSTSSSSSTSSHPPEDHAAALSALTWDQQGALDWEVLARATYFSGPVFSSFAWNIAVRRHYYNEDAVREKGGGHGENPWAVQEDEPGVVWADGLSEIVLKREVPNPMEQIAHAGMIP